LVKKRKSIWEIKMITREEQLEFEKRALNKLKVYGITAFEFSKHVGLDRLHHKRNQPPLEIQELDGIIDGFLSKMGSQFKQDIEKVKAHILKPRGVNKKELNFNELEFSVTSTKTKVNFTFVLKQDRKKKGTAILLPITVIRKKGFRNIKGEHYIVERRIIMDDIVSKYLTEKELSAADRELLMKRGKVKTGKFTTIRGDGKNLSSTPKRGEPNKKGSNVKQALDAPVKVGDIFYNSWGYDQTNIDWYQVVAVSPSGKTCKIRRIEGKLKETGFMSGQTVPNPNKWHKQYPKVLQKKIRVSGKEVNLPMEHGWCPMWDGKPKHSSWYA